MATARRKRPNVDGNDEEDRSAKGSDARVDLQATADELRAAVLDVAWRQWRALGASASSKSTAQREQGHHLHSLIDPEALVLISLVLLRDERRLADLLHDWAVWNSDLLSVQRVKNLEADYPKPAQDVLIERLGWFATVAQNVGKDLRWRALADMRSNEASTRDGSTSTEGLLPQIERPGVRARGKHAPANSSSKMSAARARLRSGATLQLRLRLGLGVGIKADLLAFLLGRVEDWATIREIADATRYTVAAVRRATDDLAAARLIESLEGQPTSYRVVYGSWAPLLGLEHRPPRWASWHERFVFVTALLEWADSMGERELSHYALGVHGRDLLERYRAAFDRDGIATWSEHSPVEDWAAFFIRSARSLGNWMREMV